MSVLPIKKGEEKNVNQKSAHGSKHKKSVLPTREVYAVKSIQKYFQGKVELHQKRILFFCQRNVEHHHQ